MSSEILVLCATAASIGFIHTVFGPDHYLPFVVMSRARRWSAAKTAGITVLCGIGHVASSVVIGIAGAAFGIAIMRIEAFEAFRGNLAAWAFIGFGLAYFVWGLHAAARNKPHTHIHLHGDEDIHSHEHGHSGEHAHVHKVHAKKKNVTPWILFTIFVFGPCEPLIPILMYPAAKSSMAGMMLVAGVFGTVTVSTMLGIVMASSWGIRFAPLGRMERYAHAIAGATICLSGMAIQFLGL